MSIQRTHEDSSDASILDPLDLTVTPQPLELFLDRVGCALFTGHGSSRIKAVEMTQVQ